MRRLIFLAGLFVAGTRVFAEQQLASVAVDQAGSPTASVHRIDGDTYAFTEAEIPATVLPAIDPLRRVVFGSRVRFGYSGANSKATYTARLTFVSEVPRVEALSNNSTVVDGHMDIEPGHVVNQHYPIHADSAGDIDLLLTCVQGPNVEVSSVEILSNDPTPLRAMADPEAPARRKLATVLDSLPSVPARLSPRPRAVDGVATPLLSLNGPWKFSTSFPPDLSAGTRQWKEIAVPGEWAMQGFDVPMKTMACYARSIDLPADWVGKRVKLRFDSVNSDCVVWVNGKKAGGHEGGFVPFELDITAAVKPGENQLRVGVTTGTVTDTLGSVSQYAAHPVGGILRKVQLFALPVVNVATQVVTTPLTDGGATATLAIDEQLAAEAGASDGVTLAATLTAPDGSNVPLDQTWTAADDPLQRQLRCTVPHAQLWDAEHPRLYVLQTQLKRGSTVLETVRQHVGFRQVEVHGAQLLVNFKPVKLLGVCRHEVSPLTGRSVSPELCRRDAELFRDANCNYIRTSHYPPSEEFLDAADELGLFVEDESALCWVQHSANPIWKQWDYRDPDFLPYMVRANFEKMATGRDHPSVVLWSLANESAWSPLWAEVLKRVAALDPTRPQTFHDQCWGGFNNFHSTAPIGVYHYPGLSGPARCDTEPRPILFGEYSHIECYNRRELLTDPGMRDDWGRPQEQMVDSIQAHPGCLGGAIWSGIDDIFHLPGGKIVGYGPWGIIDGWRREKPEYWQVKETYSPVRVLDRHTPLPANVNHLSIPVENRYNFTNLDEIKIAWALGAEHGVIHIQLPPRTRGALQMPLSSVTKPGDALSLTFTDPRGFVCESELLPVAAVAPATQSGPPAQVIVVKLTNGIRQIVDGKLTCRVNEKTGAIAFTSGDQSLITGVSLMLLPLNTDTGGDGGVAGNDYQNHIVPFTPCCANWKLASIKVDSSNDTTTLRVNGTFDEAVGGYTFTFRSGGDVEVGYAFKTTRSIRPRQWGVVLMLPRQFDTLHWDRDAQWTVYPGDDIGRPIGVARADARHREGIEEPGRVMTGPWSADTMDLGSNDFRSTKYHIRNVSLTDVANHSVTAVSDGTASARAWVDGASTNLLVAGFHTGGSDGFDASEFASERRPLAAKKQLAGHFSLQCR